MILKSKSYYKKRDDFGEDEDAYNDYLEEMEDIGRVFWERSVVNST